MADKSTRDDAETFGETLPDGPRSEGGPASSSSPAEAIIEPIVTALAEPAGPDAAEPEIGPEIELPPVEHTVPPLDHPESEPLAPSYTAPEPPPADAPPHEATVEAGEPWHAAIAGALALPGEDATAAPFMRWIDHAPPATEAEPAADARQNPVIQDEASAAPTAPAEPHLPDEPASEMLSAPVEPASDAAPNAPAVPPASADFTAAAEDLFRPADAIRDPHLITIGRRLDPSLRIPRPTAPDIAPRIDDAYAEPPAVSWANGSWQDRAWIAARYAAYAAGGYLALVLVLIVLFRFVNPPGSMLMLTKLLTGNSVTRTWVPIEQISPNLVRAVIVSEDGRFCEHSGIDTAAIREAIERASGGVPRGASTISMQVTKNLFLWNAKSYVRKVIEIPLTLVMEMVWPKRRVLETYLNIAEWGPGIFGAEAAAQHQFQKPASRLSEREAALLAAVLPNPVARDAGSPGPGTSAKARVVQARVKAYGAVASCVVTAAAPSPAPATATKPARKAPLRTAPRRKPANAWAPTLNFTP